MSRFRTATALERMGDGRCRWDVPDGWQQGRGAWGGLVAGGVAQAVVLDEPDADRPLRTLSVHMSGPLTVGPATVRVEPLRVGSGMSTWSVFVQGGDGEHVAHAVAVTGRERVPELADAMRAWGAVDAPPLPPWRDVAPVPTSAMGLPTFMQHVELRVVEGLPTSGTARCTGYVRFADQDAWDTQQLVSIVDAWFPTALAAGDTPRPMATVTYAAHVLVDPATVPPDEPLGFESHLSAAHAGFTSEVRRLWTPDGRLAVENHQSVVIIR